MLYRRKGKEVLTEKEFVFSASMDLRWFSPKDAQKLLDAGLAGGVLKRVDGNLLPTFDFGRIDVPIDYRPDAKLLKDATATSRAKDLFSEMVDTISRSRSVPLWPAARELPPAAAADSRWVLWAFAGGRTRENPRGGGSTAVSPVRRSRRVALTADPEARVPA